MIELTSLENIILGLYIIAHGGIHLIFLGYFKDEKTNVFTGWSRTSWLLNRFLGPKIVKIIGFFTWIIIAILFAFSGLIILDILPLNNYLNIIIISASIIGILSYIVFFDGLKPTPYHWILGVLINAFIIIFYSFFIAELFTLLVLLLVIWAYGMLFHTKVMKSLNIQI